MSRWGKMSESNILTFDYSKVYDKSENLIKKILKFDPCPEPKFNPIVSTTVKLINSHIAYTLALQNYNSTVTQMILNNVRDELPPLPSLEEIKAKHKLNKKSEKLIEKEQPIPINSNVKDELLNKIICALLVHSGFELGEQNCIKVLTDVLDDILKKICTMLREAVDNDNLELNDGFPDELERVFFQLGLNGINGLKDFYNTNIINHQKLLYEKSLDLTEEYINLFPKIKCEKFEYDDVINEPDSMQINLEDIKVEQDYDDTVQLHLEEGSNLVDEQILEDFENY